MRWLQTFSKKRCFSHKAVEHCTIIDPYPLHDPLTANRYTGAALLDQASQLRQHLGLSLTKTHRVAVLFHPSFQFVAAKWAAWITGTVHTLPEWKYTLQDSGADIVLYSSAFRTAIKPLESQVSSHIQFYEWNHLFPSSEPSSITQPAKASLSDNALIIYTSGTTGRPKGVQLTYGNVLASISTLQSAWKWTSHDHILSLLPLHHVHGLINVVSSAVASGATLEFMDTCHGLHARDIWQRIMMPSSRLTLLMAVPTVYAKLAAYYQDEMSAHDQARARQACRGFRLMVSGSAALPMSLFHTWEQLSGHRLLERYGMTEIGMALGNPLEGPRVPGQVGKPFQGVSVKLIHQDTLQTITQPEEPGELYIKSDQVTPGYLNRPIETAETMSDSWFKTGDIAVRTGDDCYKILGRASVDIIKSGGYKLSALDIERVMLDHPDIAEVAVLGRDDPKYGQIVAALIVTKSKKVMTLSELKEFLLPRMAKYKIPRVVKTIDKLPRNALGKVNKVGYQVSIKVQKELQILFT